VPEWDAELVIDAALVRRLVRRRFAHLELRSVRRLAEGWDNSVWLIDERWAFRFPRRAIAVPGVRRELAILPRLRPWLPLAIPAPAFVGAPGDGYPWPFFGAELIAGRELSDASPTDDARTALGRPLGRFLRRLHSDEVAAAAGIEDLPVDPTGRGDMTRRVPATRDRLAQLADLGLWSGSEPVDDLLAAASRLPPDEPAVVAHGDLHFRHLLVGDDGLPTGIIDWGDVCRADPSIDLPLYWCALTGPGRAAFTREYGPLTEGQSLRARVLAVFLCAALAIYAEAERLPGVRREALQGLRRATEPER
jgi:aminoglycoside phosphotransferase (APT) family kinase protein